MIVSTSVNLVRKALLTSTALVASFVVAPVYANASVVDGTFVEGSGTFTNAGNKTTITVHDRNTIANFNQYNINVGQSVHYQHDLGTGAANHLSRVTGGNESRILGSLTSDKVNVYLVNPNGIFFGANSKVNVPNLVASTSDIADSNFVTGGKLHFSKAGNSDAKIINNGEITIQDGGLAALVAPGVENNGVIAAKQGSVQLASGEEFTVDMYGDKLINFAITKAAKDGYVKQTGKITAVDGIVALTTQDANNVVNGVINMDGIVEADTITIDGGDIILGTSSEIIAKNLDGNGGKAIIRAGKTLVADGSIDASATGQGKGGYIDTSAPELYIGENIAITTSAESGEYGEWLIDPQDFTIDSGFSLNPNFINNNVLSTLLGFTNITLQTAAFGPQAGDINVNANVLKLFGGETTLSLLALNDINIASGVTIGAGLFADELNINLAAQNAINNNGTIFTNGGDFNAGRNPIYSGSNVTGVSGRSNSFTNNGTIDAGIGDVTVRANLIQVNNTITADRVRLNTGASGRIELDAVLNGNQLLSNTNRVDVISDNGIINQAVELVNAGGIVNLGADIFDQSMFINKNIDLLGGILGGDSIIAPTSVPSNSFLTSYNGFESNKSIILVQDATANISGITVDGSAIGTGYQNTASNYERLVGIGFDNASGTVDGVTVQNISDDAKGFSVGIFADSNTTFNDKSGGGAGYTGIDVASGDVANSVTVQNSSVENYQSQGIHANGDLLTATIDNNIISTSGSQAIAGVNFSRATGGFIINNTISNDRVGLGGFAGNSSDIILDRAASGILVDNNTITGGNDLGVGIQVYSTNNATISNNNIQDEKTGVYLHASNDNVINNNIIRNNNDGVIVLASSDNSFRFNTITDNVNSGLSLLLADNNRVLDNNIRRNGEGVFILLSQDNILARNAIINNDNTGVRLQQSNNNIIRNNDINRNLDGVSLADSDANTLNRNDILNNDNTGVVLTSSDSNSFTNNNINNNSNGLSLTNSNINIFTNNDIRNNSSVGLSLTNSNNNSSNSDRYFGNSTGVLLSNSHLNSFDAATITNNGIGIDIASSDSASITNSNINGVGDIGLRVDGGNAPIILNLDNVVFGGTQTNSAITFQNATLVGDVNVNDVQLLSVAPVGWQFTNVSGGAPTDVLSPGDMDFGNTVFDDTYTISDIHLTNSLMDGDASGVTFINDGGDPSAREARVFHTFDDPAEGTIFYNGFGAVTDFGNLFGNIARRTDLQKVYYNSVSTAGKTFDTPSIDGVATPTAFNAVNDFKVSLAGNSTSIQVASNASPSELDSLQTAAGGDSGSDLANLETAAGENTTCEVSFANNFLDEDVLLANADGSCGVNAGLQQQ